LTTQQGLPISDFISDVHSRCTFVGFNEHAIPLLDGAGLGDRDGGYLRLAPTPKSARAFAAACADLRYWARTEQT